MKTQPATQPTSASVSVRPLRESELDEAKRIFHLAFGTFLGLPDPMQFWPDRDYVRTRYHADPSSALAAEVEGQPVGTNFATNWGSVGFFGPLTIRPDSWDRGVAKKLLEPTMELFARWGTKHAGLFTFAQSAKHVGLYQKFGFWPRFLTAIMSTPVHEIEPPLKTSSYYELTGSQQAECVEACRQLTDAIYEGLNVQQEIHAVAHRKLGDTVLLWDDSLLAAFAVCHCGPDTEAGKDTCYVKFGSVRPGPAAGQTFERLLDACESFALRRGLSRLEAGVNLACHGAYERMLARGFHTDIQGVAMHKPNDPGYNRPDVYLIDDWR
jgi:GNAT superfamily N-acetyltransferase